VPCDQFQEQESEAVLAEVTTVDQLAACDEDMPRDFGRCILEVEIA
jgi:hypothetical protein